MAIPKQERLKIGQEICEGKLTEKQACETYKLSQSTVNRYKLSYATSVGLDRALIPKEHPQHNGEARLLNGKEPQTMEDFQNMTKEELINELIKSKVNEARAKKGYEVKGDGPNRVYSTLNSKISK